MNILEENLKNLEIKIILENKFYILERDKGDKF
jgi:hypothetical protein